MTKEDMPSPEHYLSTSEIDKIAPVLRQQILKMITKAKSGHPGGSLSVLDIILTLYSGEMRYKANEPMWAERDRFVLSKGHGVPALYAVMANKGFFAEEMLYTLREIGSPIQGHPANALLPGIEASTGSLGQGLSVAQGIALAGKLDAAKNGTSPFQVYAVLGDGEMQEGQIWEVAMSAPRHHTENLCAILDWNKAQIDGLVEDVMPLGDICEKMKQFGWHVQRIDGHDTNAMRKAFKAARAETTKPSFIAADTIKGKGVSFMEENLVGWHGRAPTQEELEIAITELSQ